ncbi:MAG: SIS domain-containing protein [Bacteroidota bacterium]|jgi:D-sedoheptulose 7-phosphate isomerase
MRHEQIQRIIKSSMDAKQALLENTVLIGRIAEAANRCSETLSSKGKILLCGNGGSAADAQHIAAELSGRFYTDRPPLYAEALHVNGSYMTAVANDYSYDVVYSRMVEAAGRKGDVLIGLSTSGNSGNVVKALEAARELGMVCIGLTGDGGGKMAGLCDIIIDVPSKDTPRIQECHILIGHILCQLIEESLFPAS